MIICIYYRNIIARIKTCCVKCICYLINIDITVSMWSSSINQSMFVGITIKFVYAITGRYVDPIGNLINNNITWRNGSNFFLDNSFTYVNYKYEVRKWIGDIHHVCIWIYSGVSRRAFFYSDSSIGQFGERYLS